jgi:hypothetical protein
VENVWRMSVVSRCSFGIAATGWLVLVAAISINPPKDFAVVPVLWTFAGAFWTVGWRTYLVPFIALGPNEAVVRNPFRRYVFRYDAVESVRGGRWGLLIRLAGRSRVLVGFAVQTSPADEWVHDDGRTRSKLLIDELLSRRQRQLNEAAHHL